MWFTLQPISDTKIGWWLAHYNFKNKIRILSMSQMKLKTQDQTLWFNFSEYVMEYVVTLVGI